MIEWEIEHRERLPHLESAQAQGVEVAALVNRPTLPDHLAFHYTVWRELGAGLVPFERVHAYASAAGIADTFWLWDRVRTFGETVENARPHA